MNKEYFSPYCKECNACGESGCCPPTQCKEFQCSYPGVYTKEYDDDKARLSKYYDCLLALGVPDPFEMTVEQAETVGSILKNSIERLFIKAGNHHYDG